MNKTAGFICSNLIIIVMLATALLMAKRAVNAKLNWPEWIGFRLGMSIYAGWLSAATILNTAISLKVSGAAKGWNEEGWSIAILWVAFVIYCGNALIHQDPVYAGVYIWACNGIKSQNTLKSDMVD